MMNDDVFEFETANGSPLALWNNLKDLVQHQNLKRFSEVAGSFLEVLWCLDQYKASGLLPRGMGKDISGAYRMKGNWFADLISLLLVNQTASPLAPRSNIQGFSQVHQIDIAWPIRRQAPLVCVETKVMGGPPVGPTTARAATADWSNRRKELKFQATDLKLFRRQQATHIDHWDNWRKSAPPSVYFLWCARMKPEADRLDKMVREVRALTETYLDGAGIFAYRANKGGTAYEIVSLPWSDRVVDLDDVVHRIANQINDLTETSVTSVDEGLAATSLNLSDLAPDAASRQD
jgi:hypothetical protein